MKPHGLDAMAAPALAALHALAFDEPWSAADLAVLMTSMGGFALAAGDEADLAGFILCRVMADEAELLTLAVAPAWRRRGVARALVEAAMAKAAESGAATLLLEVADDNPAALALYRGLGFAPVGRRQAYYARAGAQRADALVMRVRLNSRQS